MPNQQTQPDTLRQNGANEERGENQSHDPRDRAKTPAASENDNSAQAGGGEESKHGRKQKGNVGDAQ